MKIIGLGHSIPNRQRLDTVEHPNEAQIKAIRLAGYDSFPVSKEPARLLAARAALAALNDAGLSTNDLGFIVAGQSSVPDYIGIDLACQVGAELGGLTLRTLNLVEGCASAISTWFAADRFARELPPDQAGVIVLAQRVSDAHLDRFGMMNAVLSDGAAAAIVVPDRTAVHHSGWFQFIGGREISETRFVDIMRIERGGVMDPYVIPEHDCQRDPLGRDRAMELYRFEGNALMEFLTLRTERTISLIREATLATGHRTEDRLVLLHTLEGEASIRLLAKSLRIPLELTNHDLIGEIGHMGCVDPLISLDLMRQNQAIAIGDRIVMSTISTGMKWGCCIIEYRGHKSKYGG